MLFIVDGCRKGKKKPQVVVHDNNDEDDEFEKSMDDDLTDDMLSQVRCSVNEAY